MGTFGLERRVAVVTGGSTGIGRAVAVALAAEGAKVTIVARSPEQGAETVRLAEAEGGTCRFIKCDVSDADAVQAVADTVAKEDGPTEILFNNAAIIRAGALRDLSLKDWNDLLSINLTGYFICSQIFGRQMRANGGGSIIHNSSVGATNPTPVTGAYSVAKAGVSMLSRQLAVEWGGDGIRSNCVSPGMILTPLSQSMYDQPGVTEARSAAIPAGRIGVPEDLVGAVLLLASDRAGYITGADIGVDGGYAANLLGLIPRAGYERPGS